MDDTHTIHTHVAHFLLADFLSVSFSGRVTSRMIHMPHFDRILLAFVNDYQFIYQSANEIINGGIFA